MNTLKAVLTPLALALFLLIAARSPATAQPAGGNVTVYADAAGSSCSVADKSSGEFTLYVLHTDMDAMLSIDMRVIESADFTASFVSESIPFIHIGTFRGGVSIAYGQCSGGTLLLGTITYLGHGTSSPCSSVDTTGNPNFDERYPLAQDCWFELLPAPSVRALRVNPTSACQFCAVPTRASTWGSVKALYRD